MLERKRGLVDMLYMKTQAGMGYIAGLTAGEIIAVMWRLAAWKLKQINACLQWAVTPAMPTYFS